MNNMAISETPSGPLENWEFDAILSVGVQLVNHMQMSCEAAIEHILGFPNYTGRWVEEQRVLLISQLIHRTSSPPLDGPDDHSEWTGGIDFDSTWLDDIDWRHTIALRQYRDTHDSSLSENAKDNLENLTLNRILTNSFNPQGDEEEFHWRGLVAGNVQSGKTATYSTLIARAIDVGYRLVIVLSGRLDSLRRQTANRLHIELVDSAPEGVTIHHLTEDDDTVFAIQRGYYFNSIADRSLNDQATLIVAKKDSTRLHQLNQLLIEIRNREPNFRDFPVLIIDDECDEAGVDIGDQAETSKVHFNIKRLISNPSDGEIWREFSVGNPPVRREETQPCVGFRKTMYLGFSATPYATVFQQMHDQDETERLGLDLYPRDYLLVLDDPPHYCGGEVFIGRHEVVDEHPNGESINLPEIDNLVEHLVDIPMNVACPDCLQHTIQSEDGNICTHIGKGDYRHFWHLGGTVTPTLASDHCPCACHTTDEAHLISNPFNDSIDHFQPQLISSLRDAIDDFILAGAARIQRGDNYRPTSMMILISTNSYQHFRIREMVEEHIDLIADSWPGLGHRRRLQTRWDTVFRPDIQMFDQGFELIGGGNTTEEPNRVFLARPVNYDCEFDTIADCVPRFLNQINHIVLNSGAQSSGEEPDNLDFDGGGNPILNQETIPNLKGIFYGGYSLGRGLTLKGLTTTYVLRLPGDGSVATQMQRWCGYRSNPGEDILDLVKIYMPETLSQSYRELITVDKVNRFRLSLHSREDPPSRPEEVFHYLQEPGNGFSLVSAAKEGMMTTIFNPLSGREKTETTYRFTTNEDAFISENWSLVDDLLQQCHSNEDIDIGALDQGILLRNVPVQVVLSLIENWQSTPHSRQGYNLVQMGNFIEASVEHDELQEWSIFLPSQMRDPNIEMKPAYNSQMDRPPLQQIGDIDYSNLLPFNRVINGRRPTPSGATFRIGTVTSPAWRTIDGIPWPRPENSNPLLIITPIIHPFNRAIPISENFQGTTAWVSSIEDVHWPTVPSLAFCFPQSSTITARQLGHSQFNQN